MDQLWVQRPGSGTARTRPTVLLRDKAYSLQANRAHQRSHRSDAVIPEPKDQQGFRKFPGCGSLRIGTLGQA
ncbi:hypothetical protein CCYS_01895 [Corynebacterium cystitidis DSM 20524]|uniref:Transposase n=1 Tax=Corynebacterium cystitidis DSM 20524 TaxID=1121357 RepID=A0A1H9W068_9CORY|nr:hypothetical protein CCYS_01895 [Corynebacterium cystitidis DSM 20524]SES27315.1 hypothetical protein SAMN05661109_02480 [Corynebacterium cystitidis DSM 20524]SNV88179.1 transposase IS4 family protein [Corynebacterium cystitidis]